MWGGLFRIFLYQHATFSVNSICHMFGRRSPLPRRCADNSLVALLVFGEGWHNNHHAFPASARHGLSRFQLDVSWWVIRALERARLVCTSRRRRETSSRVGVSSCRELKNRRSSSSTSSAQRSAFGSGTSVPQGARSATPGVRRDEDVPPLRAALAGAVVPLRECDADTPGTPGSQRSSAPWNTVSRFRRNVVTSSWSGIHGARPTTSSTEARSRSPPTRRRPSRTRGGGRAAHRPRPPPRVRLRRTTRAGATTSRDSAPRRTRAPEAAARVRSRATRPRRSRSPRPRATARRSRRPPRTRRPGR